MIFVDTSFWVAAAIRRDSRNDHARELGLRYRDERLLTTNQVAGETWTHINARAGHAAAVDALSRIESSPRTELVHVEPDLESAAWRWLRGRDERSYSFVDATSFAVMTRLGISQVLAYDADFAAAGFELLTR